MESRRVIATRTFSRRKDDLPQRFALRKYAAEFIGTFFLVFTIVTTVLSGATLAPLAIGVTLTAMVFAGGHISGAHFNPAVTLAVWIRGKIAAHDVPGYVIAQVAGAVAAAEIAHVITGKDATSALDLAGGELGAAFVAEALVTFALGYVVLNVATSSNHPNNSFYGLAIGFTVMAGAIAVGSISGGVFNPAVAFGVSTAGLVSWSMLWVYVVADCAGAAAAAYVYRLLNPGEWGLAPTESGRAAGAEPSGGTAVESAEVVGVGTARAGSAVTLPGGGSPGGLSGATSGSTSGGSSSSTWSGPSSSTSSSTSSSSSSTSGATGATASGVEGILAAGGIPTAHSHVEATRLTRPRHSG